VCKRVLTPKPGFIRGPRVPSEILLFSRGLCEKVTKRGAFGPLEVDTFEQRLQNKWLDKIYYYFVHMKKTRLV
jgi:hypothetical protein